MCNSSSLKSQSPQIGQTPFWALATFCRLGVRSLTFIILLCSQYSLSSGLSGEAFPLTRICLSILCHLNIKRYAPVRLSPNTHRSFLLRFSCPEYLACHQYFGLVG